MKIIINILILILAINLNAQSLVEYIDIARKNNSEIKIKNAKYELSKEKINEVANHKNTKLGFGVFALTPETRVGSQLFSLNISQKLPWFGEFTAQKNAEQAKADLKQFDIALNNKDLTFKVKQAYYKLYKQIAITDILKDNKQILKTYENMALAALANNRATMSDVLRIRIQKNELHSKIFKNLNGLNAMKRNFNRLLERDINQYINIVDSLNVLDILINKSTINNHPSLVKMINKDAVYKAEEQLINIDKKPKLEVGLNYILVNKRNNLNINQNGKDILMPSISLAIPLFNKKHKSQYKQIEIKKEILENEIENQKNNLEIALESTILEFDNAVITVVAAQKNKTETQRAINVDLKAYETGILNYDKILKLQIQKIKYQLLEIEAIKNAFIAKSKATYLTE